MPIINSILDDDTYKLTMGDITMEELLTNFAEIMRCKEFKTTEIALKDLAAVVEDLLKKD